MADSDYPNPLPYDRCSWSSSNPPVVTGTICDPNKSQARYHRSLKRDSKLKYLNIDQLLLSQDSKFRYSESAKPTKPYGLLGYATYPYARDLQFKPSCGHGICDQNKCRARCHRSLKLGSKLNYLNIDQLLLSLGSQLGYS